MVTLMYVTHCYILTYTWLIVHIMLCNLLQTTQDCHCNKPCQNLAVSIIALCLHVVNSNPMHSFITMPFLHTEIHSYAVFTIVLRLHIET